MFPSSRPLLDLSGILRDALTVQAQLTFVATVERDLSGRLVVRNITVDEFIAHTLYPDSILQTGGLS